MNPGHVHKCALKSVSSWNDNIIIIMIWAFAWRMCHLMRFVMFWLFDIPGHAAVIKTIPFKFSLDTRKPVFGGVRPGKTQSSLLSYRD